MRALVRKSSLCMVAVVSLTAFWQFVPADALGQEKKAPGAKKQELAALQGTWKCLRWEEDGKLIPVEKDTGWVVNGTKVKNSNLEGNLELVDVSTTPAKLNIQFPERKLDEFIYVRAGDYLIMCGQRGGPRPSEFKTAPREQGINQLLVFKIER